MIVTNKLSQWRQLLPHRKTGVLAKSEKKWIIITQCFYSLSFLANSNMGNTFWFHSIPISVRKWKLLITQPVGTLFLFKSIWTRPQGSQGCPKIQKNFLHMKLISVCANILLNLYKLQKTFKIEKNKSKNLVFLKFFEYSSIWGQY